MSGTIVQSWQYKVEADIRGGSLEKRQTSLSVEWSETAIFFNAFGVGSFRIKANVITQYYLVHH